MILLFPIFLCACSLQSPEELEQYAKTKYGKASVVKEEKEEDSVTCYLKDKEYGFEYWITSKMVTFNVDGSDFFDYTAQTSNFEKAYYQECLEIIEDDMDNLEEKYEFETEYKTPDVYRYDNDVLLEIRSEGLSDRDAEDILKEVSDLLTDYDTRKYWVGKTVKAYDNDQYIGSYDIWNDEYKTAEEEEAEKQQG